MAKLDEIETSLDQLSNRRYQAPPQPKPPTPAELERLARYDRELELESHAKAVADWTANRERGKRQFQSSQANRRRTLQQQRKSELEALQESNPRLLSTQGPLELDPAAVNAYSSCDRAALAGLSNQPAT